DVAVTALSASQFSVRITPSSMLAAGRYTGTLSVRLCKDVNCAAQFSGSPVSLPYDFNVQEVFAALGLNSLSPTSVTTYAGGDNPPNLTLRLTGDRLRWTLASNAAWLQVGSASGTGGQDIAVALKPDAAGLTPGDYKGRITATTQDGQTAGIDVNLQVLERQFVVNGGVPSFTLVNGSTATPQTLNFALNNQQAVNWTASSAVPWMRLSPLSGVTPGSLTLQPDATIGPLSSGSYSANITLASAGIASKTVTSQLTLTAPQLSTNTTSLVFGGAKGRDFSPQLLSIGLNTNVDWPWSLSGMPAWLLPAATTGKA
ncbi:hypothetical protein WDZ92_43755, partial [Nostoc sp. NIES-2111]